jgi:hypothetical protein
MIKEIEALMILFSTENKFSELVISLLSKIVITGVFHFKESNWFANRTAVSIFCHHTFAPMSCCYLLSI